MLTDAHKKLFEKLENDLIELTAHLVSEAEKHGSVDAKDFREKLVKFVRNYFLEGFGDGSSGRKA